MTGSADRPTKRLRGIPGGKLGGKLAIGRGITIVQETFGKVFNAGTEFERDGSQFDRLFEDAAVARDDATRQTLYSRVQKILVEDAAVAWLTELDFPTFTDKRIKDLVVTGSGVNDTFARAYRA